MEPGRGTLNAAGTTIVQNGGFAFNGGTIFGVVYLGGDTVSIGSVSTGAGELSLTGNNSFSGNIAAGQTLWLDGFAFGGNNTAVAALGNITNDGTILFSGGYTETLNIGGTLTNAADGMIQISSSGNGGRVINGNVINTGQIDSSINFNLSGSVAADLNYGDLQILGGTVNLSGKSFTNEFDGLIGGVGGLSTSGTITSTTGRSICRRRA